MSWIESRLDGNQDIEDAEAADDCAKGSVQRNIRTACGKA